MRAAPRRRARTNGTTNKPSVITGRQIFMAVLGGITSAGATAALVNVAKMRPVTAGATVGALGGVGAAISTGRDMRPFATGAAVCGAGITAASWMGHFAHVPPPPPPKAADTTTTSQNATTNNANLPPAQRPELVAGVPPGTQNGNPATNGAQAPRQASSVSADMRTQIQRAMQGTNFRPRY